MLAPRRQADLINGTLANIIHRYKIYQIPEEPVPQMLVFIEPLQRNSRIGRKAPVQNQ